MAAIENLDMLENTASQKDWWRGAVIYQVYPRSFQDSTGDGIGDLSGIVQRLPYIASLGVDALWISPFFSSPMKDFGYDVSDYRDIDPMFGSLADFDALVDAAHSLGLKVIIDLVLSHTSDQHPWFVESRSTKDNPKSNWYVWADPKPDGTPPNNWLSIFGGSAWNWDPRRCQYYLHNFLTSQPDLNFHEPEVENALLDVVGFWLDRGVDGFRLDTINFYFADKHLRDNPPLDQNLRNSTIAPAVNPYNFQEHVHSKNQPENIAFLKRLRSVMDQYGAMAVGEVGDAQSGLEILGDYTRGTDLVQMCYAFELLSGDRPTANNIAELFKHVEQVASDGWACWAYSNHDVVRHKSRWNLTEAAERVFITLMMCLRGSVCIYQGEEIGLPQANINFADLQDPYGKEFWPEFKGRDGCRTPMVWEPSNRNGGFSSAQHTWLPVSSEHLRRAVSALENDTQSLLHHYRRAIEFRQHYRALAVGEMNNIAAVGDVFMFERREGCEVIFCAFNLSDKPAEISMPPGCWVQIGERLNSARVASEKKIQLEPWQTCLALQTNNKD